MPTTESNIHLALFGALFAVVFGLVSAFGLYMLYAEANSALRPRTWVLGSAQVVSAKLNEVTSTKGSSTYSVTTQYRYEHAGKTYFGDTIRLGDFGSDDDKAHHEGWVTLLQEAKSFERNVPVYINPSAPEQAALSTQVRWRNVWFALPFVFLFGAVAVGGVLITANAMGWKLKRDSRKRKHKV
jgi:hypothetical protein